MREGRGTEVGEAEPQSQADVVRLPRDWLGPRENLVPFGPRAVSLDTEAAPPSAEDVRLIRMLDPTDARKREFA